MTAMMGATKEEISRLKNNPSIKSNHAQNSPVMLVLFTLLTMIRKQLDRKMRNPGVHS